MTYCFCRLWSCGQNLACSQHKHADHHDQPFSLNTMHMESETQRYLSRSVAQCCVLLECVKSIRVYGTGLLKQEH